MMKNLLMTAGVALICGVIGAAGYLYFLGAKPEESPSSQKKPDSGSAQEATEKKKWGFSGTQSVMESNSRGASSIPGFTAADDADTLKKQIADLMQRVDGLSARVDRMTRPKDETPPVLHTMQIKMGELARVMDEVASLPAKVRHYDNRLETLQEEIKTLRSRIESLTGGRVEGLNPNLALPRPSSAAAPPATDNQAESPTMELGITLLERGQYVSAREVFLRLERAQPRCAGVVLRGVGRRVDQRRLERGGQAVRRERDRARTRRHSSDRPDRRGTRHPYTDRGGALAQLTPPASSQREPYTMNRSAVARSSSGRKKGKGGS